MRMNQSCLAMCVSGALCVSGIASGQDRMLERSWDSTAADASAPLQPQQIAAAVENELQHDQLVSLDQIGVRMEGTTVVLDGTVHSLIAKERAAALARTVRGVGAVTNNLVVTPRARRSPRQLEASVRQALLENPATEAYEVTVTAQEGGIVRLSGTVDSWPERALSERLARSIAGVSDVRNDIRADYSVNRSDGEIASEVERLLRWDAYLDADRITVSVVNGAVKLIGQVNSAAEKQRAITAAWTSGTRQVDADSLRVAYASLGSELERPFVGVTDADIRTAVQSRLRDVPPLQDDALEVQVLDGVATVRGQVHTLQERRLARSTAAQTRGVVQVRDRMRVREWDVEEIKLERRIRNALNNNPITEAGDISVAAGEGGTVTLTGSVDSWFEKGVVEDVVASQRGVREIKNRLTVIEARARMSFDPYADAWSIYEYDWYQPAPVTVWRRDSLVAEDIRDQLWWSPFVNAGDVKVSVHHGVATLIGTVDSLAQIRAATENAFEGGASEVINQLQVAG